MLNAAAETDVLIVGAGPVGLFLANECARRNLSYRIIEENASQSEHSKALAIFPRTLEIFDMAGVVQPFLAAANRVTSVAIISHGRSLAQLDFTPHESPYSFIAMVPQNVTEELLLHELQAKGGGVEYRTKLVSFDAQEEAVHFVLDCDGQSTEGKARSVVGCDGAHSTVRHRLGFSFEGAAYSESFLLADIETDTHLRVDELQLCPSEHGPVAIFPISATRRRIVATIEQPEGDAPSLEIVNRILSQRAPQGILARGLHWSSYFRIHHRHVAKLREQRIFLAGDAAHVHSPFGGQGMNTGLQDVWNLVWKLDLVLKGHASDALLDTYSSERLPVIKDVIETTDRLTKVMGTSSRIAQALRDAAIPLVVRLAFAEHAFVQRLSELGIDYHGSPIVEGSGRRYFGDSLRGGKGIGSSFLLIIGQDADSSTREAAERLAKSYWGVLDVRSGDNANVILVRPDGYIAYSTHSGEEAIEEVRSVLKRQVFPASPDERAA